ncbi:MAG: hypothetical protein JO170_19615 [Verrucomicrobia bacterium]|nr:hypothetical protein [Verrucomicrobiota bacterium]
MKRRFLIACLMFAIGFALLTFGQEQKVHVRKSLQIKKLQNSLYGV